MDSFSLTEILVFATVALVVIGFFLVKAMKSSQQARRTVEGIQQIFSLNQDVEHDALDFCSRSWPILEQSGAVAAEIEIRWFGETKMLTFGQDEPQRSRYPLIEKDVTCEDMAFKVHIWHSQKDATQSSRLEGLVLQTFLFMLQQNTLLKEEEIRNSQLRLERYQMFVQHEIKNIAQFIKMLSASVSRISTDEDKIRLFDRLQSSLPIMESRATKTIQSMKSPDSMSYEAKLVNISSVVREVCRMFDLDANVLGDAITTLRKEFLIEILKNVLGNFRDHKSSSNLAIYVYDAHTSPDHVEIQIFSEKIPGVSLMPERLFEPFWTTSDSGLGLGLFLAREMLKQDNGEIRFHQTSTHYGFILTLPNQASRNAARERAKTS